MANEQIHSSNPKSKTYDITFNNSVLRKGVSDLKEAISFAYALHLQTLENTHSIEVVSSSSPVAIFYTEDYFNVDK